MKTFKESLEDARQIFKNEEPINSNPEQVGERTSAMLISSAAKKLLAYFYNENPEIFDKYLKKHPENIDIMTNIKGVISTSGSLDPNWYLVIDSLFLRFIKKVPVTKESDKGIFFGKLAHDAGCNEIEAEAARKLLSTYIEPVLKNSIDNKSVLN